MSAVRRVPRTYDEIWEEIYEELREYHSVHGDCEVITNSGKLGHWVCKQRVQYKREKLLDWRRVLLEKIGFTWILHKSPRDWFVMVRELCKYVEEHGDCLVPTSMSLGWWVHTQRYRRDAKHGVWQLEPEKVEILDELGFAWGKRYSLWGEMYSQLEVYHQEHWHCRVPKADPYTKKLWNWTNKQRQKYKNGKLNMEQTQKMNDLNFVWRVFKVNRREKSIAVYSPAVPTSKENTASSCSKHTSTKKRKREEDNIVGKSVAAYSPAMLTSKGSIASSSSKHTSTKKQKREEDNIVGKSVAVYSPDDDVYYRGKVNQIGDNGHMFIKYDDGDKLLLNPIKDRYKVLQPGEPLPPREISPTLEAVLVGSRLDVWWPVEQEFHAATVRKIKPKRSAPYKLKYDDGAKEWTHLSSRKFLMRSD